MILSCVSYNFLYNLPLLEQVPMEAEQLNAISYQLTDLDSRVAELRRYL